MRLAYIYQADTVSEADIEPEAVPVGHSLALWAGHRAFAVEFMRACFSFTARVVTWK